MEKVIKKEKETRLNLIKQQDDSRNVQSLITKQLMDEYNKKFDHSDEFLSNELLTLANQSSSTRINMFENQLPQSLMLLNPDVPKMYTGYEREIGQYSKSYYQSDRIWKIIHKISRYKIHPNLQYYLVVVDQNGIYDIIQRRAGEHLTESYAYMNNNTNIDTKNAGDFIQTGEVLYKSSAFDDSMNYRYGKNAKIVYLSCTQVTEDAIWASEEFCKQLEYCTMTTIEVPCNGNEIFINLYGNDKVYKEFPDISESIQSGILCAKRNVSSKTILYNLSNNNLRRIMEDEDDIYYSKGTVIGIDIYCNKEIDQIDRNPCNAQLMYYYDEQLAYYKELRSKLGKIITNNPGKVSDRLLHVYHRASDLYSGKTIVNGNSKFEGFTLLFTIMNIKHAKKGSKISGRFGEKGVIGKVSPKCDMPRNQFGEYVDMVVSPQGVWGRLNFGQWTELELTFLCDCVCRDLKTHNVPYNIGMPLILEFYMNIYKTTAEKLSQIYFSSNEEYKQIMYMDIIENGLKIHQPPFWGNCGYEELKKLYIKYPYPRYKMTYKGEPIIKRLIMGTKYVILLKQTPESKYSARSLGMQSSLGHPSKSIKYKKHLLPHSDTPIRVGEMEVFNMLMMNDTQAVANFLKIYANSQLNREEFVKTILTTDNPFDIRYDATEDTSINRKMMNAYFKAGGSALVD